MAMQPNSQNHSKLRVTVQQASLSPLPPPPSLMAPVTNISLHDNSVNRREYYCKCRVRMCVCYIYAQKKLHQLLQLPSDRQQTKISCLHLKKKGGVAFWLNSYNAEMHFSSSVFYFLLYLAKNNNVFIQTSSPYAQLFRSWEKSSV